MELLYSNYVHKSYPLFGKIRFKMTQRYITKLLCGINYTRAKAIIIRDPDATGFKLLWLRKIAEYSV